MATTYVSLLNPHFYMLLFNKSSIYGTVRENSAHGTASECLNKPTNRDFKEATAINDDTVRQWESCPCITLPAKSDQCVRQVNHHRTHVLLPTRWRECRNQTVPFWLCIPDSGNNRAVETRHDNRGKIRLGKVGVGFRLGPIRPSAASRTVITKFRVLHA